MKPSINASMDELRDQMNRGGMSGASPGSSGNIMPGANALSGGGARAPSGGSTSALKGIPSRGGAPAPVKGRYQGITGSPAPGKPLTSGNVPSSALGGASHARDAMLAHGRVLAGVSAIRAVHGDHPHLRMAHQKSSAHIASYKNAQKMQMPPGPKFGSLGGSAVPGAGGSAPGSQPLGMASLPDEM